MRYGPGFTLERQHHSGSPASVQDSQESPEVLIRRHGINPMTVAKWGSGSSATDARTGTEIAMRSRFVRDVAPTVRALRHFPRCSGTSRQAAPRYQQRPPAREPRKARCAERPSATGGRTRAGMSRDWEPYSRADFGSDPPRRTVDLDLDHVHVAALEGELVEHVGSPLVARGRFALPIMRANRPPLRAGTIRHDQGVPTTFRHMEVSCQNVPERVRQHRDGWHTRFGTGN